MDASEEVRIVPLSPTATNNGLVVVSVVLLSSLLFLAQEKTVRPKSDIRIKCKICFILSSKYIDYIANLKSHIFIFWNPFPKSGAINPHALIVGESGAGKTETIRSIVTELAQKGINSIIFDYGQGFSLKDAPSEFLEFAHPIEIKAIREGVNINPLKLFPFDINGPINVAQRVADTFQRVYSQIGVQQHSVLRQAIIDLMTDSKFVPMQKILGSMTHPGSMTWKIS